MSDSRYQRKPKKSHPWVSWKPGWLTRRDQELRGMIPKVYHCACGWSGLEPSISDGSYERPTADGVVIDRVHYLICPRCFANLSLKEKEHDGLHSRPTQPA